MRDIYKAQQLQHKHLVEPIITPRFLPTCSKELLRGLAKIAKDGNVDIQSHLSESGDEVAFTQSIYGQKTDSELFDEVSEKLYVSLFGQAR
jgi:guanine deaminase